MALASPSIYEDAARAAIRPDPRETISEWADKFMQLPSESAEPGRWRTSRFPFIKEIMDCLSPLNPIREVVFKKPVQVGGTSVGACWIGHTIHRAPASMLIVEPTVDFAKKLSRQRIAPMIDLIPELTQKVKDPRSRDSGNTMFEKEFMGGRIVLTGANSGTGLRFMAAKNLMLDEVDAYPASVDNEGSPVDIAEKRTATFSRYKIFKLSTPLVKSTSVIEEEYLDTDQRKFYVPCPFCDHGQTLTWEGLTWKQDKPETAAYLCEQCRQLIPEHKKTQMLSDGAWLAQVAPEDWARLSGQKAGFHLNILYQPYGMRYAWPYLAREWTKIAHSKNLLKMQQFVNLFWAEVWEEQLGEKLDYQELWNRREIYPAPVPKEIKIITAFVDTQDDRLEAEVRGFGPGKESWGLGFKVMIGSPADKTKEGPWAKLDEWMQQVFHHETLGPMRISMVGIDSGGHFTKEVYDFVRPRQGRGVVATKGSSQPRAHLLAGRTRHKETGIYLYSIGTDAAKDSIIANLKLPHPGPGFFHWSSEIISYDEEYFQQVCSEVKIPVKSRGRVVGSRYMKLRDRNEALDLLVGNWFMVELTGVDLNQYTFDYRDPAGRPPPKEKPNPISKVPAIQKIFSSRRPPARGSRIGNWRQ
jgi:phage terminase large subunit GpA-like protein